MNTKDTMVSVVVPVYNRENTLKECVQSVLNQTYTNFEILLIDDGSTDKSLEISKTLCSADERVKLFSTKHIGVSGARNIGIDKAQGKYIFFLDSDDIIHPQLFESLVCSMEQSGASVGSTYCRACRSADWETVSKKFLDDKSEHKTTCHKNDEALSLMFEGKSPTGMIGGTMISSALIGDTRFSEDLFIGEDFYFIYQNLIKGADVVFSEGAYYLNRIHKQNTSWQYGFDGFWTRFQRRILVWRSEESFGRTKHANIQKSDAYSCFNRCISHNRIYSPDAKKMRKVLREYKNEITPAFSVKYKTLYIISAYLPLTNFLISGTLKKKKHK